MGTVADALTVIAGAGFSLVDHFTLPDAAWWDDFYTPMERRVEELRARYRSDSEALAALDELARESDLHRHHSGAYAYEFFVARAPGVW